MKTIFAVMCASIITAAPAYAHSDESLETQKAPHGGQLRMAGAYHFELVLAKNSKGSQEVKENPLIVYVTDHAGAKVSTAGATGAATLLAGKLKASITLAPDGDNRMKGYAKYASTPDIKVVANIVFPGKAAEQARFAPMAVMKEEHIGH